MQNGNSTDANVLRPLRRVLLLACLCLVGNANEAEDVAQQLRRQLQQPALRVAANALGPILMTFIITDDTLKSVGNGYLACVSPCLHNNISP